MGRKIFIDSEFMENGKTITPISIGMVHENGLTLYLENSDCDLSRANNFVRENVVPKLEGRGIPRKAMAARITEFCGGASEFWGYYADYDWVLLCQLFGGMMDLPEGWPMFCNDLEQLRQYLGADLPMQEGGEHHALLDAQWIRKAYLSMTGVPVHG